MRLIAFRNFSTLFTIIGILSVLSTGVRAQTESAKISGLVVDASGAVVDDAQILLTNIEQGTTTSAVTNHAGIYVLPSVRPGQYRISARKAGFKTVDVLGVVVNVQDRLEENFRLQLGSRDESITVTGGAPLVNTQDATVSTVVDRNFAENLPLNGRSFHTLIELTPGVIPVVAGAGNGTDSGQFSVNGQRAASNYWTVDGVSANAAASSVFQGNQMSGATPVTSVLGGTNSLVPVDDMQEFRIQTSSFAPEFGRTPGAQISIVTRSGNNIFHGSAFDYLRNDVFDAKNWFNGYNNPTPLPKAEERQNDFGGTFGGPILKNRTFFFFSYEGLRLRLPTTTLSTVPDLTARQTAVSAMQPIFNAFPFDVSQPNHGDGTAQFNASYSNPGSVNDYNLRIDHKLNDKVLVFARYNYSPSKNSARATGSNALSTATTTSGIAQQLTSGASWSVTPRFLDEFRFNYSRTDVSGGTRLDTFGGAQPFQPEAPSPLNSSNSLFGAFLFSLQHGEILTGPTVRNVQHQTNFIDTLTVQTGSHNIKAGIDFRRLNPVFQPFLYLQSGIFFSLDEAQNGISANTILQSRTDSTIVFKNLGVFVQDAWRVVPRLTITYGVRWDTDFSPEASSGPPLLALASFHPNDFSTATLAPLGTPPFHTDFTNVAPRLGVAYELSSRPNWGQVLRGGAGLFYDLATSETANALALSTYPYSARSFVFGQSFPLTGVQAAPPPIAPPTANSPQAIAGVDPTLKAPYTLQWNVAIEQGLGQLQSLSLSYVGAAGRGLLQTSIAEPVAPGQLNPAFTQLEVATNSATSDYHALQAKFDRRLFNNLQVLSSYTLSHSIDTGSAGSAGLHANRGAGADSALNRGSSDFDIRHSFTLGATYALPGVSEPRFMRYITRGWSIQNIVQAHSAPPVDIQDNAIGQLSNGFAPAIRPDVVPGVPLYLYGSQYPGGKAINFSPGAAGTCADGSLSVGPFCPPPVDANFTPLHPSNLSRNALRGFGLFQWDFAIHREFPIREQMRLEFRGEMFNILNHPNFAFVTPADLDVSSSTFGRSSQILGQYLGSGAGSSGLNSLYQTGGPRSMQFAMKFVF
jgi:hypothetical protein